MNDKELIEQTLKIIKGEEKKKDWLVKQMLNLSQAHVSFKQKKKSMILLATFLAKLDHNTFLAHYKLQID